MSIEVIKEILVDLGIEEEKIYASAYLRKDLELDSTETVEIALELKRRFGVEVKLESRQDLTVAQMCALVDQAKASNVP